MKYYCGIDLHSNNHYVCVIDDNDKRLIEKKLDNNIDDTLCLLSPYRKHLTAVAIESTFNWYWLVDGLMEDGYRVDLVNTAAVVQYEGLKRTDDRYDAFHLAHLMRLGILPTGYIYPKKERGLRDLMRRRMKLVQEQSQHLISLKTQHQRQTGQTLLTNKIKTKSFELPVVGDENVQLSMQANLYLSRILAQTIHKLEVSIMAQIKQVPRFALLKTVDGIGDILAETIMFETGSISRFKSPGNFASYCRCVDSRRTSNGKKKGAGNRKNGNKYLAWAFIEAASKAICHSAEAKKFYEKKKRSGNACIAMKALAHKLARACYHIMKNKEAYNPDKLFA